MDRLRCMNTICFETIRYFSDKLALKTCWCHRSFCCGRRWRCWNFWQIGQIARYFQLIINLFDTSYQTIWIFVCSSIQHWRCFDTVVSAEFANLYWWQQLNRKTKQFQLFSESTVKLVFCDKKITYAIVVQNTRISWYIKWTSASHKFPYEMITGLYIYANNLLVLVWFYGCFS